MKILLDTNILLDVLARREPFYEDSAAVWNLAESGVVSGYVSAISFNNVYYIVRRFGDRRKAHRAVTALNQLFHVAPVDGRVMDRAVASSIKDFEDAIQWASACEIGVERIITRNARDFPTERPVALSPTEFLQTPGEHPGERGT